MLFIFIELPFDAESDFVGSTLSSSHMFTYAYLSPLFCKRYPNIPDFENVSCPRTLTDHVAAAIMFWCEYSLILFMCGAVFVPNICFRNMAGPV